MDVILTDEDADENAADSTERFDGVHLIYREGRNTVVVLQHEDEVAPFLEGKSGWNYKRLGWGEEGYVK